jgi:hypothetical protein
MKLYFNYHGNNPYRNIISDTLDTETLVRLNSSHCILFSITHVLEFDLQNNDIIYYLLRNSNIKIEPVASVVPLCQPYPSMYTCL